jgi:hypothetical protein
VARIFHFLFKFEFQPGGREIWGIAATALCQTAILWLGSALVFARRDVTISPE